eukprot:g16999.t1
MRAPVVLVFLQLASVAQIVRSVLPPGYEDDLFCAPGFVKVQKHFHPPREPGWAGPVSANYECFNRELKSRTSVVTWGSVVNTPEDRQKLLKDGYTLELCTDEAVVAEYREVVMSKVSASTPAEDAFSTPAGHSSSPLSLEEEVFTLERRAFRLWLWLVVGLPFAFLLGCLLTLLAVRWCRCCKGNGKGSRRAATAGEESFLFSDYEHEEP